MKIQYTFAAATALIGVSFADGPGRATGNITLINNCDFPIYAQLHPGYQNHNSPDPLATINPGYQYQRVQVVQDSMFVTPTPDRKSYIDLTLTSLAAAWTTFYGLGINDGYPFSDQHVTLMPSNGNCGNFDCKPGDKKCYYNEGNNRGASCERPVDLEWTFCA